MNGIQDNLKYMTCQDFFFSYLDDDVSDIIDEMYWTDSYSADRLLEYMISYAAANSVILTDLETFDSDGFFWGVWNSTEKGLS